MLHHLLLKFSIFFIAGIIFTVGLAYFFVPNTPKLIDPNGNVLGQNTDARQDQVKSFVQGALEDVLTHISKSPALEPFFTTKQSVETAVSEVQDLPDAQRKAVCQEICSQY